MKMMMKEDFIKEIVTGAPTDIQHQNNAHLKNSQIDWWGAADQWTMSHGTHIHNMIWGMLNYTNDMYIWNQTGINNSII